MRWALRRGKRRRMSTSISQAQEEETKHFTFSVISPSSCRHPAIASMTRDHLEAYHEYPRSYRFSTRPASPNSVISELSDRSETKSLDYPAVVVVEERLRILILVTGIWVAFREGWSHHSTYGDPVAKSHVRALESPRESRFQSSTTTIGGGHTALSEEGDVNRDPRRRTSIAARVRHLNVTSSAGSSLANSLVRRSNSTRTI